jgi:hypothetical protein
MDKMKEKLKPKKKQKTAKPMQIFDKFEIDAKFQATLHFEKINTKMYMKNKNFRKLKYVQANPENAGFCTIYRTASGPDPWPISLPVMPSLLPHGLLGKSQVSLFFGSVVSPDIIPFTFVRIVLIWFFLSSDNTTSAKIKNLIV